MIAAVRSAFAARALGAARSRSAAGVLVEDLCRCRSTAAEAASSTGKASNTFSCFRFGAGARVYGNEAGSIKMGRSERKYPTRIYDVSNGRMALQVEGPEGARMGRLETRPTSIRYTVGTTTEDVAGGGRAMEIDERGN